jgi:hypothetical protein
MISSHARAFLSCLVRLSPVLFELHAAPARNDVAHRCIALVGDDAFIPDASETHL